MIYFVNIKKEDFLSKKLLYRFMSLEYALGTLNDKHLWFADPTIWKDPFEKRFLEAQYYQQISNKQMKFPWLGKVFCSCFTQVSTSEAYWNRIFDGVGIEFKFIRERLLDTLESYDRENQCDIYIGKIDYLATKQIQNSQFLHGYTNGLRKEEDWAKLLLMKRMAYKYEDEIRIIIVKRKITSSKGCHVAYACANTELIDTITLDPRIGKNVEAMLKSLFCNKYGFASEMGKPLRVQKSMLYTPSKQLINIKI